MPPEGVRLVCTAELLILPATVISLPSSLRFPEANVRSELTLMLLLADRVTEFPAMTRLAKLVRLAPVPVIYCVPEPLKVVTWVEDPAW